MNRLTVSRRLYLLVAAAAMALFVLALGNAWSVSRLQQLKADVQARTAESSQVQEVAAMADELYRVIADTVINRHFDDAAKKWKEQNARIDAGLAGVAPLALTPDDKAALAKAGQSIQTVRGLYLEKVLPLAQSDGDRAQITAADDAIDETIDQYNDAMGVLVKSLGVRAQEASALFDGIADTLHAAMLAVPLVVGLLLAGLAGAVARSITRELGIEPREVVALAARMSEGDLTPPTVPEKAAQDSAVRALAAMSQTLSGLVQQVRHTAEGVAAASAEIAQGSADLSARTESQASTLQQTTATLMQLGTAVRHNADNASMASQLASQASGVAQQGGRMVRDVVDTMAGISESSRRIGAIIGTIDGIAFQTNILALNAAVEAARAGEQGRGFAVVAGEVRSLAKRSAEAAREIKDLIGASVERVDAGQALVERAGQTMDDIVQSIQRVTDIVSEISSATGEQSQGVGQVSQAVSEMDTGTQQNSALVEQSTAAASGLADQSRSLVSLVARFRTAAA